MAGGGRRHYNPTPRTALPNGGAVGTAQFWPASIWQLPDLSSTPPPSAPLQPPKRVVQQPPGSQLAQALDAAVQAAVIRALDFSSGVPPLGKGAGGAGTGADDDNASSASCSSTRSLAPDDALGVRLRSVLDANVSLHARAEASEERAEVLERRVAELEALVHAERDERQAAVARLERRLDDMARRMQEQHASLREQLSSVSKSGARAGSERARVERASREHSASAVRRVEGVEAALSQQLAALAARVARVEEEEGQRRASQRRAQDECAGDALVVQVERQVGDAVAQSVGAMRGRLRKLESATEARRKADEEANALQMGHVEARLDKSCTEVAALKKLVECNLRAHSSAQDIVKTQVSTVTKHVCAAMRAYTTRRLDEHSTGLLKKIREEMLADDDGEEDGRKGTEEQVGPVQHSQPATTE